MASIYYGTKGSGVIEMQKYLNAQGANIVVDGIWGDKTEQAYNSIAMQNTFKSPSAGTKPLTVNTKSNDEIDALAKQKYETKYLDALEDKTYSTEKTIGSIEKDKTALEPAYQQRLEELNTAFALRKQQNENAALSKGIGRSSYYSETQQQAENERLKHFEQLVNERNSKIADMDERIERLRSDLQHHDTKLSREKEMGIVEEIAKLTEQRDKEEIEAVKYNNQLNLQLQRFNAEQQKAVEKGLSSKSSSKGTSSSASKTKSFYNEVMDTWYLLSDGGRITYFYANADAIAKNNPSLFSKLDKEVNSIIKSGVNAKRGNEYGYYNPLVRRQTGN